MAGEKSGKSAQNLGWQTLGRTGLALDRRGYFGHILVRCADNALVNSVLCPAFAYPAGGKLVKETRAGLGSEQVQ